MTQQYAQPPSAHAAAAAAAPSPRQQEQQQGQVQAASTNTSPAPSPIATAVPRHVHLHAPLSPSPLQHMRNASDISIAESSASAGGESMDAQTSAPQAEVSVDTLQKVAQEEAHDLMQQTNEDADEEEQDEGHGKDREFARNRKSLMQSLDKTRDLLVDLKEFNYGRWIVHYPELNAPPSTSSASGSAAGTSADDSALKRSTSVFSGMSGQSSARPSALERAASSIAAVQNGSKSAPTSPARASPQRSYTLPPGAAHDNELEQQQQAVPTSGETEEDTNDLSILRLDLKIGPGGHAGTVSTSTATVEQPSAPGSPRPGAVVHSLAKSSVAQLLDGRMTAALRHLSALRLRIADKQSKVLVTGDLNAGKSTLVNSLLRRKEIMPTDQQPCTTVFCEVLDAHDANDGKEEVHVPREGCVYNGKDESTYTRYELADIEQIVAQAEERQQMTASTSNGSLSSSAAGDDESNASAAKPLQIPLIKCYCHEKRSTQESLLRNGVVDIALIDAPGLNRDSLQTTALFARQEEIDVIVFVVSAENHFTLSAKEFLWNASNEKAYVFIVVNKFDQIRNKDKCKKRVLDQIRQLSPRTWEDADELVHFVDSSAALVDMEEAENDAPSSDAKSTTVSIDVASLETEDARAFARLEASLRDFVLLKRSKSKLLPAQTYVLRLLSDISFLARTNVAVAKSELEEARARLSEAQPALEDCKRRHEKLSLQLEDEEDAAVEAAAQSAEKTLVQALNKVGKGQSAHVSVNLPAYPGLLDVWQYAEEVRLALLESIEAAVKDAEEGARRQTSAAVASVRALGNKNLPADVERSTRVFQPEVMFSARRSKLSRKLYGAAALGPAVSGGYAWLGLGLDVAHVRATDIVDVPHYFQTVFPAVARHLQGQSSASSPKEKKMLTAEEEAGMVGSFTLGLGALTLVSGKALGAKAAIEGFVRVFDLIGNKTARQWAAPILAVGVAGAVIYVILDLPQAIPRNIGRSLQAASTRPVNTTKLFRSNRNAGDDADDSNELTIIATHSDEFSAAFTALHTQRVSREVRKVMRLGSFDLQETFRVAIAERSAEVEKAQNQQKCATGAIQYFEKTGKAARAIRDEVQTVRIQDDAPSTSTTA